MKKIAMLSCILILLGTVSCKKSRENHSNRIGFYCLSKTLQNSEEKLKLFIDDVYQGDVNVSDTELTSQSDLLFFMTLDGKKHQVDLKNSKGEYLSANYLQAQENKTEAGSSRDLNKMSGRPTGCSVKGAAAGQPTVFAFLVD